MRAKRQKTTHKNEELNLVLEWVNYFTKGNLSDFCNQTGIDITTAFAWKRKGIAPADKSIKRILDAFGLSEGDYWGGPEKYKDKRKGLVYNNDVKPMNCPVYSLALMKPILEDSLVIGYAPTLDSPDYFILYIDFADVNVDGLNFYLGTKHLVKKCQERDLHDGDTILVFNNNSNQSVLLRYRKEDGNPLEQGGLVVIGYIASMQLKPTPSSVFLTT